MEREFPSNSRKAREGGTDDKKLTKIVEGPVTRRRKPLGKKFGELFVTGDSRSVSQYVFLEVLLPAARDAVVDAVSQGIERMIFGEVRSSARRSAASRGPSPGYVSYNRYAAPSREDRRPPMSRQARATHNFDEIILNTRREADEVLDNLSNIIERYEAVTVSDLYELIGETSNYADEKWGWTDLRGASVTRARDGYLLDLPKPVALD
jgi:hypothetical protein